MGREWWWREGYAPEHRRVGAFFSGVNTSGFCIRGNGKKRKKEREGKRRREGGGGSSSSFHPSPLLPPSRPLPSPPALAPTPALSLLPRAVTGQKQRSSLGIPARASREVSLCSSQTRFPRGVFASRPFRSQNRSPRTQPASLPGARRRCSAGLSVARPHGMRSSQCTRMKAFQKECLTWIALPYFHSQRSSWD